MFNLLMFNVDWQSGRVAVPMGRMFEYTDDQIAEQFRDGGNPLLDRLTSLPCLFCEEGTTDETAYVGHINRARIVGKEVSLEISFDADAPPQATPGRIPNPRAREYRTDPRLSDEAVRCWVQRDL